MGINLLKDLEDKEGFRPKPYNLGDGKITIGIGTTVYPDGRPVKMSDPPITLQKAREIALKEVDRLRKEIDKMIFPKKFNQNQKDALVSLSYNIGLAGLRGSTLIKKAKVNPNDPSIKDEFPKWHKVNGVYNDKLSPGLIKRRKEESDLYFSGSKKNSNRKTIIGRVLANLITKKKK